MTTGSGSRGGPIGPPVRADGVFGNDNAIVLDDEHLRRLLSEYLAYYHWDRTHLGVEKDAPVARPVELRPAGAAVLRARRRVGGLYHRYEWAAAA